jgi:arginase
MAARYDSSLSHAYLPIISITRLHYEDQKTKTNCFLLLDIQCKAGVEAAPMALVEAGLLDQLRDDLGYKLDYDDTVHYYEKQIPAEDPDHRGMKKPRAVSAVTEALSTQVYEKAKEGQMVLTLGGDHSIAIGSISGSAKATRERLGRELAVIWVDAHADINVPEMSPSGNIHGMPMAFLTRLAREEQRDIFGWLKDEHIISTRKLVYIGLRDVDRGEKQLLREHGIKAFSMHDVDRYVSIPERKRRKKERQ